MILLLIQSHVKAFKLHFAGSPAQPMPFYMRFKWKANPQISSFR